MFFKRVLVPGAMLSLVAVIFWSMFGMPVADQAADSLLEGGVESFPVAEPTVGSEGIASGEQFIPTIEVIGGQVNAGGVTTFPYSPDQANIDIESYNLNHISLEELVMATSTTSLTYTSKNGTQVTLEVVHESDFEYVEAGAFFQTRVPYIQGIPYFDGAEFDSRVQYLELTVPVNNIDIPSSAIDCIKLSMMQLMREGRGQGLDESWILRAHSDLDEYWVQLETSSRR